MDPADLLIAENVRVAMARRNISYKRLATQVGIPPSSMRRRVGTYQVAPTSPFRATELIRIAEALDVDYIDLVPARAA